MEKYKATVQYTPDLIRKAEKVINKYPFIIRII